MSLFGLNLAQVKKSLAQVGLSLSQVNDYRRLLPNPTFNRSKAKISLLSCLAFRKYLNLYVFIGVKPRLGKVIPRTGRVILAKVTYGDFFKILLSTGAKPRSVYPHVWHS